MKKSVLKIGILSLCLSFFTISASAQLLWSESFTNYTESQNLHGVNGWDYQDGTNTNYRASQVTPLTYSHLITSPGYFVGGGGWQNVGIKLPTLPDTYWSDDQWQLAGYKAASTVNNTMWISFLVRNDANTNGFKIGFYDNNIGWNVGDAFIQVNNSSSVWGLSVDKGATKTSTSVASTLGSTYLIVVKLTFGEASTAVSLYVNPTLDANNTVPATPSAAAVTAAKTYFRSIPMYLSSDPNKYSVDEFRVGVNYADVVPNDLTTGLSTANEVAPFTVCAANNTLHLNFSKEMSNTQVTIFDVQGRQMTTALVSGKTPAMNIENLNKGIYIVRTAKGTARFIK